MSLITKCLKIAYLKILLRLPGTNESTRYKARDFGMHSRECYFDVFYYNVHGDNTRMSA